MGASSINVWSVELGGYELIGRDITRRDIKEARQSTGAGSVYIPDETSVVPLTARNDFVNYASNVHREKCVFDIMFGIQSSRIVDFRPWD